ncbi:MAG TPA: DUF2721 domain-containing protein [Armatimonadota bacterium]|jgi:hypothetical protein
MLNEDWSRVISTAVVPVVIISACGLLCLAFYNRLASIVARLRAFQRERFQEHEFLGKNPSDPAVVARHQQFLQMLDDQTRHVTQRAHLIRNTLLCLLLAIGCLVVASLMAGLSVVAPKFMYVAAAFFLVGMVCVLAAVTFAIRELVAALQPIELESRGISEMADLVDSVP